MTANWTELNSEEGEKFKEKCQFFKINLVIKKSVIFFASISQKNIVHKKLI